MSKFNVGDRVRLSPHGKNFFNVCYSEGVWRISDAFSDGDVYYRAELLSSLLPNTGTNKMFCFLENEIELVEEEISLLKKDMDIYRAIKEGRGDRLEFTLFRLATLQESDWEGRKKVLQDLLDGKHDF